PLVSCLHGFTVDGDEYLVYSGSLTGMAGCDIAVRDMTEFAVDHPAIIDLDVSLNGESFHSEQGPVGEAVLAILGCASCRNAYTVADRQRERLGAVDLKPFRQFRWQVSCLIDRQSGTFAETCGVLVELDQ